MGVRVNDFGALFIVVFLVIWLTFDERPFCDIVLWVICTFCACGQRMGCIFYEFINFLTLSVFFSGGLCIWCHCE